MKNGVSSLGYVEPCDIKRSKVTKKQPTVFAVSRFLVERLKTGCGGVQQIFQRYSLPEILIKLEKKDKSRWPFGWDVLRKLSYPPDYPFPPKPPTDPCGWGGARY